MSPSESPQQRYCTFHAFAGDDGDDCADCRALRTDPQTHELKVWPPYFEALLTGEKTFELRRDDRGYGVGDRLKLREFDPDTHTYSGREVERVVSYIISGGQFGLAPLNVCLALQPVDQEPPTCADHQVRCEWMCPTCIESQVIGSGGSMNAQDIARARLKNVARYYADLRSQGGTRGDVYAADDIEALVATLGEREPSPRSEHGRIDAYRVEPDPEGGEWHVLTFEDGWQLQIYTNRPCIVVEPQKH